MSRLIYSATRTERGDAEAIEKEFYLLFPDGTCQIFERTDFKGETYFEVAMAREKELQP